MALRVLTPCLALTLAPLHQYLADLAEEVAASVEKPSKVNEYFADHIAKVESAFRVLA